MKPPPSISPLPVADLIPGPALLDWLRSPELAFVAWTNAMPWSDGTKAVKQAMWLKFMRWVEREHLNFSKLTSADLEAFLKASEVIKEHRRRYVRLLEKVFDHLNVLGLGAVNPGRDAAYKRIDRGTNDRTAFLDVEERRKVELVIEARLGSSGEGNEEKKGKGRKKQNWVRARDAAIAGVMIGAGAAVVSIRAMAVNCTNCREGRIRLPREGGGSYEAIALPIADLALTSWLRLRRERAGVGDIVFPADLRSRGLQHTDTPAMHPSTIFRAVRSVLAEAGVTGPRACGQTLRNTYCATLMGLELSEQEVADAMGFQDLVSASRMRSAWLMTTRPPAAYAGDASDLNGDEHGVA